MDIKKLNETILKTLNEGATECIYTCKSTTESGIKKAFNAKVEEDRYEYGNNPYNGSFTTFKGIKILDKVFNSYDRAEEYILDNQEKWGPALAVIVKRNKDSWRKGETFTVFGGWAAS